MRASNQFADATSGVVYIHASPAALCPHVQWALESSLGTRPDLTWTGQPHVRGQLRASVDWCGPVGTGARVVQALRVWPMLTFEITEDASEGVDGQRFCHVPDLGLWSGTTNAAGDVVVGEMQLRALMSGSSDLAADLRRAMGSEWDEHLEPLRVGDELDDGAEVTWLRRRVG